MGSADLMMSRGNILKGRVVEINAGLLMTELKVDIGGAEIVTVRVDATALKILDAQVGDEVEVCKNSGLPAPRKLH